jgi:hypothetical protein
MRFTIEQQFSSSPTEVVGALTDPDLYATYKGLSKVAPPEVLEVDEKGGLVHLSLRMRFIADLPSAARRVVDPAKLSWVQDERYDVEQLKASVLFRPDNYADRFSCSGGYTFESNGGGCVRRATGDLKIRMLLVGGQVENAMVSGLREHFAEEQPLIERWLAQSDG